MVKESPTIRAVGPTQRKAGGRHSASAQADATHTGNPSDSASPTRTINPRTVPSPPPPPAGTSDDAASVAARHPLEEMPVPWQGRSGAAGRRPGPVSGRGEEWSLNDLWSVSTWRPRRREGGPAAVGAGGAWWRRARGMPVTISRLTRANWELGECEWGQWTVRAPMSTDWKDALHKDFCRP